MPDYGHDVEFGYFLEPNAADPVALRTFIADVAPAVREQVAALRASRSA